MAFRGWQNLVAYGSNNLVVVIDPRTVQCLQTLSHHKCPVVKVRVIYPTTKAAVPVYTYSMTRFAGQSAGITEAWLHLTDYGWLQWTARLNVQYGT